jgi:hypothetical protein
MALPMCVCYAILTHLSIFHPLTQAVILCEEVCVGLKSVDGQCEG